MFLTSCARSFRPGSRRDILVACLWSSPADASRHFSSNQNKKHNFRARRRTNRSYRPVDPKAVKEKGPKEPFDISRTLKNFVTTDDIVITDTTEREEAEAFGPIAANAVRLARRQGDDLYTGRPDSQFSVETQLRMMDYMTSAPGSTEELVGERRALALEMWDDDDLREHYETAVHEMIEEERIRSLEMEPTKQTTGEDFQHGKVDSEMAIPPSQLAHGDWGEMLIRTDRVRKMWRGGRVESFRALVIGGNLNGCGGFGFGKAFEPEDAVEIACRMARHNIFFVDRYRGASLTRDLFGRQNSCKVILRCTNNGLRGNPLVCEMLKLMGIDNVVAKAHGSRNHYNVVRATFKALMTHESLEEIARKRGVRLANLEKAKRLQI